MDARDARDPQIAEAEALLRRARPAPSEAQADAMEHRMLGRRSRARRHLRLAFAGLGFSGALAAVVVVAGLAGVQPWNGSDDQAGAKQDCVTRTVTATMPTGTIVQGADGEPRVVTVPERQMREVTRCR